MKENGHVKVLMSAHFNNVEVLRPLAPDATDDEYRREFDKAMMLCQDQVRKLEDLNEDQNHFYQLLDEYLYVKRVAEAVQHTEEPPNEAEQAAIMRYERLRQFCFDEHSSTWDWDDRMAEADSLGDELAF